jgi:hypothetical protein
MIVFTPASSREEPLDRITRSLAMLDAQPNPRCPSCDTVLVHSGAICVICDDKGMYEAPILASPPISGKAGGPVWKRPSGAAS